MSAAARWENERKRINRFVALAITGMTLCLGLYLVTHYREEMETVEQICREIANAAFQKDVAYRRWNAMHGGVYVPVTDRTPKNPWLTVPEREITTPSGRLLTKVNPAYMTRQVYELMRENPDALIGHITSLRPIRPENAPYPWERDALATFEKGGREYGSLERVEGRWVYRFMRPFITEKQCLACHAQHGYREGEIRGGISISVPADHLRRSAMGQIRKNLFFSLIFWGAGCGVSLSFRRRLLASLAQTEQGWEEAVRREQTYRTLFESSHAVMLLVDPDSGRIIRGNPAASRFYGYREEEFPTLLITDINIAPREEVWDLMGRVRKKEIGTFVTRHRTRGGDIRTVEVRSTPVEGDGGVILHSIIIDITERIEAERQAEENLCLAWSLINQSIAPTFVIDTSHRVVVWNRAMEDLTGVSPQEVLGTTDQWRAFYDAPRPCCADAVLERALTSGSLGAQTDQREFMLKGKKRTLQISAAPVVDGDGSIRGVIETIFDLTETLELRDQLLVTQKMETMGLLASGIAHDFNNILTVISGYAAMIASSLSDPDLKRQTDEIMRGVERAAAMTRNILAFSGKRSTEKQVVDLVAVVSGMQKMLRRLIPESISFSCQTPPAPLTVEGDRTQIEQAVMNLVVNARDAVEGKGAIRLTLTETLHEGDEHLPAGHYGVITVEDDGTGIAPELIDRIFDPFVSSKGSRGTGLGLSIVKTIATNHGGRVTVESAPGSGSRFRIFIPLMEGGTPPRQSVPDTPLSYDGTGTILLVEDDTSLRKVLADVLTRHGYEVKSASSGDEGWSLFSADPDLFSAVVTDLVMCGMNGADLVRRIQEISPVTPCILISGYHDDQISGEEIDSRGIDFLSKPFTPLQLLALLKECLTPR